MLRHRKPPLPARLRSKNGAKYAEAAHDRSCRVAAHSRGTYLETPAFGLRINKRRKIWFVIRGRARLRTTVSQYLAVGLAAARYPRLSGAIRLP